MNASAEARTDAFEPTSLRGSCGEPSRVQLPPVAAETSTPHVDVPLNSESVARAVPPAHLRQALESDSGTTDAPRQLTMIMDWAVVLTLVGLFVVAGLL